MEDIRDRERQRIKEVEQMLRQGVTRCFALLKGLKFLDELGIREELVPTPEDEATQEGIINLALLAYLRMLKGAKPFGLQLFSDDSQDFEHWLEQMFAEEPWRHGYRMREALFDLVEGIVYRHPASLDTAFHVMEECVVELKGLHEGVFLSRAMEEALLERVKETIERQTASNFALSAEFAPVVEEWSGHEDAVVSTIAKQLAEHLGRS